MENGSERKNTPVPVLSNLRKCSQMAIFCTIFGDFKCGRKWEQFVSQRYQNLEYVKNLEYAKIQEKLACEIAVCDHYGR